jgi:uncharacterized protein YbdZ (MbtH family)
MTFKWWPIDKPIPKGWRFVPHMASHHTRYSILIEKIA